MPHKRPDDDAVFLIENYPINTDDYAHIKILPTDYQPDHTKPNYNPHFTNLPMDILVNYDFMRGERVPRYRETCLYDTVVRYIRCYESANRLLINFEPFAEWDLRATNLNKGSIKNPLNINVEVMDAVVRAEHCKSNFEFYHRFKYRRSFLGDMFVFADYFGFKKTLYLIGQFHQYRFTANNATAKGAALDQIKEALDGPGSTINVMEKICKIFHQGMMPNRPSYEINPQVLAEYQFIPVFVLDRIVKKLSSDEKRQERAPIISFLKNE